MTTIAIATLSPKSIQTFSGTTEEAYVKAIAWLGGDARLNDGVEVIRSGKDHLTYAGDGERYLTRVMSNCMFGRDNDEWFIDDDEGAAIAMAEAWMRGDDNG